MSTEMKKVFGRSAGLTDVPFSFCPGCTHGNIMRLIAEVLEELEIIDNTIGISPVGCAGLARTSLVATLLARLMVEHKLLVSVQTCIARPYGIYLPR